MSLEQALKENTEVMKALTAAILGGKAVATAPATGKSETQQPAAVKTEAAPPTLTYEKVAENFLALVKKVGRDPALAAIAPIVLKDIKEKHTPEQLQEVNDKITKAMA